MDLESPTAAEGRETLLIVDDDEINRAILENVFSPSYDILEAGDGLEGLRVIMSAPERLCAVLLDVVMPELDGLSVLRRLHESGLTLTLPVFLITRGGQRQRAARSLRPRGDGRHKQARRALRGAPASAVGDRAFPGPAPAEQHRGEPARPPARAGAADNRAQRGHGGGPGRRHRVPQRGVRRPRATNTRHNPLSAGAHPPSAAASPRRP